MWRAMLHSLPLLETPELRLPPSFACLYLPERQASENPLRAGGRRVAKSVRSFPKRKTSLHISRRVDISSLEIQHALRTARGGDLFA